MHTYNEFNRMELQTQETHTQGGHLRRRILCEAQTEYIRRTYRSCQLNELVLISLNFLLTRVQTADRSERHHILEEE